ncbi:hypothetical protein [Alkalicoccobacillus porphyridii]|uniref:Uncharacterized protein n=1 Tax=Alkalicoccobacillus porphyridii TaxID=2597270 RepID=A0A554A1A7_9BACI|nr:hypothetical protein [Alkalicoccobacillus porphyridii]TSB47484.1 hypothetical protein FN960_07040 [Alkalicoccobacillus porphyridii]
MSFVAFLRTTFVGQLILTVFTAAVSSICLSIIFVIGIRIISFFNQVDNQSRDDLFSFLLLTMITLPFMVGLFVIAFLLYKYFVWYDRRKETKRTARK